ncbi:MAG: hypothetical protein M3R68_09205 [Acidobacteriota bacterium]|nr:hypothetical protein [Acidobacteriota bacterium]
MNKHSLYGTIIILIHAGVSMVHGFAHQHLSIDLTATQKLFVIVVITLAPLVSMLLLWTRLRRAGAALLLASMLGSLIFGLVNHFVIVSPDHVQHLSAGDWRLPFQLTAVLLAAIEILGCWIGARAMRARSI